MINLLSNVLAVIALAVGSIVDLKKREVPDTVSYGAIILGFLLHVSFSFYFWQLSYFFEWVFGFGIFFVFGCAMFYLGQWGGGDSKLLMGVGSLLGMSFSFDDFLIGFFFNTLLVSVGYNLFWIVSYYIRDRSRINVLFFERFSNLGLFFKLLPIFIISSIFVVLFLPLDIINKVLFILLFISPLVYYLHLIIGVVEKVSMRRLVGVDYLTEGDWIVEDVVVDGKTICSPKDLGISLEQIDELKKLHKEKKIDKILVKYGIPFVPCFLISFLFTLEFGNVWFKLLF